LLRSTSLPETPFARTTRVLGLLVAAPALVILALPVAVGIARGPDLGLAVHQLEIVRVRPDGPAAAAGLQPGDQVVSFRGRPVTTMHEYYAAAAGDGSLGPVQVTVRRGGRDVAAVLRPVRPERGDVIREYTHWVTGLAFLAIGWWGFWQRTDPVARNFFALCFIFAFFLVDVPDSSNVTYMHAKDLVRLLMQDLLPAYFLRFLLQFPSPDYRSPRASSATVQRLLLVPGWLLFAATAALERLHADPTGSGLLAILTSLTLVYAVGYFLAGLVVFARRALRRDRPIRRTKMRVVLVGLVCGIVPFLATTTLGNTVPASVAGPWQTMALSLVLLPVSFSLAIMRYGALDAAFVVRVSLIYGLLTLFLLAAFFCVVVVLGALLSRAFHISTYPVLLIIVAGSSLAIQPLRRLVQGWIDRTFYPSRRVHRRTMVILADELAGLIELTDVLALLGSRMEELYRPSVFAAFLSDAPGAPLVPRTPRGADDPGTAPPLPADSSLARLFLRLRRPVFAEEAEDLLFTGEVDPQSLHFLTQLDAALFVPLVSGNRLIGFLAFGPKAGSGLYSQEDLANLRGLAIHVASTLESRQLYRDSLEQERLEAELNVAREIQARLLPTAPLVTPAYAVAGRNDPCRAVGGDYYDYFLREDGRLAVAIADVAGKGIPAALMMTSLCTAFRREAEGGVSPSRVMRALNAFVGERVTPGGFVSFFFADWDPSSGLLRYCNAGMDPPVLFRPGTQYQHRLRKGGPVLGAAQDYAYREGAISLEPGDRLFLHTDGLTEERNRDGEFFDEDRLLAAVNAHLDAPPEGILDAIFATVAAFGDGSEPDDKTSIVLEIKELSKAQRRGPLLA